MCFAQSDFPRKPRVLDGSQWRRAGAAIVPANGDDVSAGFRDSRGNDAHARARNEFHADARPRIHRAQIVNQLRQVFDAVNVVMRRRRNQRRSRSCVSNARNVLADFYRR